jgi:hypothetical protein
MQNLLASGPVPVAEDDRTFFFLPGKGTDLLIAAPYSLLRRTSLISQGRQRLAARNEYVN